MKIQEPEWIFPFDNLSVGDSFFIPTLKPSILIYAIDLGSKRYGIKVKSYVTFKEDVMGVRTWRLR